MSNYRKVIARWLSTGIIGAAAASVSMSVSLPASATSVPRLTSTNAHVAKRLADVREAVSTEISNAEPGPSGVQQAAWGSWASGWPNWRNWHSYWSRPWFSRWASY